MKNIIFIIFATMLLCVNAKAICCPVGLCIDLLTIPAKGLEAEEYFHTLDQDVANQIDKIKEKIKESHEELEADSKTILENTRKLNREFFVMEQNILHNQIIINDLQNIVIDAVGTSAEVKSGKNSLEFFKKEFSK